MSKKIIDIHAHMGDIFTPSQNNTFKMNVKRRDIPNSPFAKLEASGFSTPLIDGSLEQVALLVDLGQELCHVNTAENISKDLDKFGISYICLYPILPNTSFEEYKAAAMYFDKRFLPFTSADFNLSIETMIAKLESDIAKGAYGLKIHPVLQNIRLSDPRVEAAIEVFGKAKKPIVSHCGANDYYHPHQTIPRDPEAGDPKYFIQMVKKFPQYTFIAAHAGGLMGGEMDILYNETKGLSNFYLDTTFRSAEDIKKMVQFFGPDRPCFGTDKPFSTPEGSLKAVMEACGDGTELEEKILYKNALRCLNADLP